MVLLNDARESISLDAESAARRHAWFIIFMRGLWTTNLLAFVWCGFEGWFESAHFCNCDFCLKFFVVQIWSVFE